MTTMRERKIEDLLSRELDILESAINDENKALAICSREEIWKLVYRLVEQELKKEREEIVDIIKNSRTVEENLGIGVREDQARTQAIVDILSTLLKTEYDKQ